MWRDAWSGLAPDASAQDRRAIIDRISADARQPLPAGIESKVMVARHGLRTVRVVVFRKVQNDLAPCLIYMHGGGFMQGSPETHDEIAVGIVAKTGQTVVSVDYSLAPERPFPAAVMDCETVVYWVFESASDLAIRADAVSVGGDSAGANLAAVMALVFRDRPQSLKGQLLFYPVVDTDLTRPSYTRNANGPIITTAAVQQTWTLYCGSDDVRNQSALVAPLRAPNHHRLPPAFVAVAENDPLLDEGLAYADVLSRSGVPVELRTGAGLIHGYLRAMQYSQAVRREFDAACNWLRRLYAV
ncbi:alpha/beta hydrolase [Ferrovibrio terrae]|uniref:alpha/beta hydrolase n=1 Tax=Ferrovibrio terrae TaxID=2594003 RepID=UPI003137F0A7